MPLVSIGSPLQSAKPAIKQALPPTGPVPAQEIWRSGTGYDIVPLLGPRRVTYETDAASSVAQGQAGHLRHQRTL
jgi:hypothetical protein